MSMEFKRTISLVLLVSLSLLVADVHAGWKFWKKDTTTTTTTTPTPILPAAGPTPAPVGKPSSPSVNSAIAGAANPGLAIGVGATGEGARQNARPQRPNPGTEVGLDFPASKPNRPGVGGTNGQGYRDWAVDLTGAGEPGRPGSPGRPGRPGLPSQGPALTSGGQQPSSGSKPAAGTGQGYPSGPIPGSPTPAPAQRPGSPTGGNIPAQRPGSPTTGGNVPAQRPGSPNGLPNSQTGGSIPLPAPGNTQPADPSGRPQVSTLHVGTLKPGSISTPSPLRPGQSGPGSPNAPSSPTGGKTFADVAAGGSRPGSPTPSPRQPGHATPAQPAPGQRRPQSPGQPAGQTRPSTGTIAAGGALAGGALAGGAIAAGNANRAGTTSGGSAISSTRPKVYSTNPTYSKGNTVTDEDLEKLSEALFQLDTNLNRYVTLNLQKQTTGSSPVDEAPQPLFSVSANAYQANTVQKVLTIYDNYKLDTKTNEHLSPLQRQEESLLIDTFLSTNVMSAAMRFLADKSLIRKDYYEYKDALRRLWFDLFARGEGRIGSTGFEHVFLSELKTGNDGTDVLGLHNWIYYSKQEAENRANYLGYIKKIDLSDKGAIVKIHTTFNGHDKPVTTMFVGTSPELEMALYTVCFYTRPEQNCPVSLGGTKFNIITHNFKYRGKDHIGSAYPDI